MSNHDEDDKPTVVIDLKALKKQREEEAKKLEEIGVDLEFTATQNVVPEKLGISSQKSSPCFVLFDFSGDFFEAQISNLPSDINYEIVTDVKILSAKLKDDKYQAVAFYFNQNPKSINQLCAQIKAKFKSKQIILFAKQLTPDKVKVHKASASGAHGYISIPFSAEQIKKTFSEISSKKVA
jgi:hypothetical protein